MTHTNTRHGRMLQIFNNFFLAITWVKDGVAIEPSEKYQIIDKDDGTCELTVNYPTKQDNGKYVCQGTENFSHIFLLNESNFNHFF